jgi:hypothetical protein
MLYNLINPTDLITFHAPDTQVAALAVLLFSNGKYGADCVDGTDADEDVPTFLKGGALAWWSARYDQPIVIVAQERMPEVLAALRSFVFGTPDQRRTYDVAIEALTDPVSRERFAYNWALKHAQSKTGIDKAAKEVAQMLEDNQKAREPHASEF